MPKSYIINYITQKIKKQRFKNFSAFLPKSKNFFPHNDKEAGAKQHLPLCFLLFYHFIKYRYKVVGIFYISLVIGMISVGKIIGVG